MKQGNNLLSLVGVGVLTLNGKSHKVVKKGFKIVIKI